MITAIITDFSRVILHPRDTAYTDTLNGLYRTLNAKGEPFHFFDYFTFDEDVIRLFEDLHKTYPLFIFTTGIIQNAPGVQKKLHHIFDEIFSAEELGMNKKDPASYTLLAQKIGKPVEEILYIDDSQSNVEAAKSAGMATIRFEDAAQLEKEAKRILEP